MFSSFDFHRTLFNFAEYLNNTSPTKNITESALTAILMLPVI